IDEVRGFTSEIFLNEVGDEHKRAVRNLLTAGSSLRVVARDRNNESGYLVHANLYTTLARIRARELAMFSPTPSRQPIEGGRLRQSTITADSRSQRLLGNGRDGRAAAGQGKGRDLYDEYWDALLDAVGLDVQAASRLTRVRDQATAAWQALTNLA